MWIMKILRMEKSEKMILLDADVISHFIKGDLLNKLPEIYPGRLIILDIVKEEILKRKGWRSIIERFVKRTDVQKIDFPQDENYVIEYAYLRSTRGYALGKGESASMAYCRFNENILASSNLKDIFKYCHLHNIEYITTKDILVEGFRKGIIMEKECDIFIRKIKEKGSKFPYNNFRQVIDDK
jgi:hypothetical protein